MATQAEQILEFMEQRGEIDPIAALRFIGCFRLAARIHDLREQGHAILDRWITDPETGKQWKAYRLAPPGSLF